MRSEPEPSCRRTVLQRLLRPCPPRHRPRELEGFLMTSPRRALRWVAALSLACGAFTAIAAPPAGPANPVDYTILRGEGQCALASVDLVTGAMQPIGTEASTKCVFDLAFTPD